MKASWEKLEKNEGVLTIEVEKEKVNDALDQAFKKVVKNINVPGFRKGKVPRQIFEARFGVESLYQDALDILLPQAYAEAVDETGIEPIDQPEVDVQQIAKGEDLKFTAKVQVKPEVKLGEYKGIEVEERDFSVTDEELENELKQMQERHAELVVVEDRPAQEGDTAVIDYEGFVDGEPFEGGKAERHNLELGSGSFIPGFEDQVIGMEKGEEKDIQVTFPEQYHSKELAGKEAVFKVKLHEIKQKVLPELDDEFALDVSEFETLEEYKEDLKRSLQEEKDRQRRQYIESVIMEKVAEAAEVEIPEPMIKTETDRMIQEFSNQMMMQGMNLDMYYQMTGQNEQSLREQMKDNASRRVLNNLVLEAISEAENIQVSEEDIKEELEQLAKMYQQEAEQIRQTLEQSGNMRNLEYDIKMRNTIQFLVDNSKMVAAAEAKDDDADADVEAESKAAKEEV